MSADAKDDSHPTQPSTGAVVHHDQSGNADDARLAAMGYKPELQRRFGLLSCIAVGFSISNSWFAVTAALVTGIANGGPAIYIYGSILMALLHFAIGLSLGELASAYPNSGGQYYWTMQLAPKSCRRFLSYLTGVVSWAGAMITGASVSLVIGQAVVGMIILANPDIEYERWMAFVAYQIANGLIFVLNCWESILPGLSKVSLYVSLVSFITITIAILAASPSHQSGTFVFKTFINMSGWSSDPVAFFTGLIGVNWGFSCLDAVTHLAEELPQPERTVPRAILSTVAIGFITSWIHSFALMFSIQDLDSIIGTATFVPNLELYFQSLRRSVAGAIVLESLVLLTAIGCLMSIHTWQSRLMWAFSRDGGFPGSHVLSRVAPAPYSVPMWAHVASSAYVAVLGCIYLGSSTGFNSLITGGILMQYISYCIPVLCLMLRGRQGIEFGPFHLNGWRGWAANMVLVGWSCWALVWYCFPYVMPVTRDNMNYVSVVIVIIVVYSIGYWLVRGKMTYKGVDRHLTVDDLGEDVAADEKRVASETSAGVEV